MEADEKFFRESRKGSRPAHFPKPDRPRWRDYHRLGLSRPVGTSKYHVPVRTIVGRAGARRADVLPDRHAESLVARLEAHVRGDAVLCSDGDAAYEFFARARSILLRGLRLGADRRARRGRHRDAGGDPAQLEGESRRVSRRLQRLREWSHGDQEDREALSRRGRHRALGRQRRRQLRQRPCREGDRSLQDRGHPPSRTLAQPRGRRNRHPRMGRLVQHPPTTRAIGHIPADEAEDRYYAELTTRHVAAEDSSKPASEKPGAVHSR